MCSYEDISKESFELAFKLASKKLASMTSEEICLKSGASSIDQNRIIIHYLNRPYLVTIPAGEISQRTKKRMSPSRIKY